MKNNLANLRNQAGLSQQELGDLVGTEKAMISHLERGTRGLSQKWLEKLSTALSCTPNDILSENKLNNPTLSPVNTSNVQVLGTVQAGIWQEAVQWDLDAIYSIPYVVSNKYEGKAYGLKVAGDSMNLVYPEGTTIIVVPIWEYSGMLTTGKRVIVERTRQGIVEATAKELEIIDGHAKLWCRSSNPKWEKDGLSPVNINWPYETPQECGIDTVEIKGIVIGSYTSEE